METHNQMLLVNFCSAAISLPWLLSDSSKDVAIEFNKSRPEAFTNVPILSAALACGQLCMLYTIRGFDGLLLALSSNLSNHHDKAPVSILSIVHPMTTM